MIYNENDAQFYTGDTTENKKLGVYELDVDSSLMYTGLKGDYSVLLGGNWRFELHVEKKSGLCMCIQSFLSQLVVKQRELILPTAKKKNLYFCSSCLEVEGFGCHYLPFNCSVMIDFGRGILCIGDNDQDGECIEFASNSFAIINSRQLKGICIMLNNINKERLLHNIIIEA